VLDLAGQRAAPGWRDWSDAEGGRWVLLPVLIFTAAGSG